MISANARVLLCATSVDMRRSFDGLAGLVVDRMEQDPTSHDAVFVFVNAARTRVKALWADDGGVTILYRRLDGVEVDLPEVPDGATSVQMDMGALRRLLRGASRVTSTTVEPTVRDVARAAKSAARKMLR